MVELRFSFPGGSNYSTLISDWLGNLIFYISHCLPASPIGTDLFNALYSVRKKKKMLLTLILWHGIYFCLSRALILQRKSHSSQKLYNISQCESMTRSPVQNTTIKMLLSLGICILRRPKSAHAKSELPA